MEVEVRERTAIAGLTFPDERCLVASRRPDVAIEAIGADVEPPADEPLRVRRLPVEHFRPGLDPLELGRETCPESLWICRRLRVNGLVVCERVFAPFRRRRNHASLLEKVLDLGRGH